MKYSHIAIVALLLSAVTIPVHASSPIAQWSLDDALTDTGTHALHGVEQGTRFVPGVQGSAILFDGNQSQITIPHHTALQAQEYTAVLWVRPSAHQPYMTLLRKGIDGQEQLKLALRFNGRPVAYMTTTDGRRHELITRTVSLAPREWHMLALRMHQGKWSIWVNGEKILEQQVQGTPRMVDAPLLLGNENMMHGRGYVGAMDEVRWYGTALTDEALQQLYRTEQGRGGELVLRAHFSLDGDVRNTGSLLTATSRQLTFAPGRQQRAATFNGQDSMITIPHHEELQGETFANEFWVHTARYKKDNYIFSKGRSGEETMELKVGLRGELEGMMRTTNGEALWWRTPSSTITLAQWHHVLQNFDGTIYAIYVDGTEVYRRTLTQSTAPVMNTAPLLLGRKEGAGMTSFHGMLDEVRLYGRSLTPEEIQDRRQSIYQERYSAQAQEVVGHWIFPNGVEDQSTYAHGVRGGYGQFTEGPQGQRALRIASSNDHARIPNHSALNLSTMSIEATLRPQMLQHGRYILAKEHQGKLNYGLSMRLDGGIDAHMHAQNGQAQLLRSRPGVVQPGQWYKVTMTYEPGSWKLYVDGALVGERRDVHSVPLMHQGELIIGNKQSFGTAHFIGDISEVKLSSYPIVPTSGNSTTPQTSTALSYIRNGGFEEGLLYWRTGGQPTQVTTQEVQEGTQAMAMTYVAGTENRISQPLQNLTVGEGYRLQTILKIPSGTTVELKVGKAIRAIQGDGSWQVVELPFNGEETTEVAFTITASTGQEQWGVVIDDVLIQKQ